MFCGHKWKKSLVDDEANRLIFRSFEYSLTFTPPTPGFKGIVFQQSMWGGQDTLKMKQSAGSACTSSLPTSQKP
jgi:hypothetical protein